MTSRIRSRPTAPTLRCSAAALTLLLVACGPPGQLRPHVPPAAVGAEVLAEGILSTPANEYNPSLSPDGRTLVFARSEPDFRNARILVSRLEDGRWSDPEPIGFGDARYADSDPTFSPDGTALFFISNRPAEGRDPRRSDLDIWRVERTTSGWGTPEHLGPSINTPAQELGPTLHDGWLYFSSTRGGQLRKLDIYRAPAVGDGFGPAEAVEQWNTGANESDPEFSPDGTVFLFWSDREGAQGEADIYVSRRQAGFWSTPERGAGPINSSGFDFTPAFSPDGRWIYFASTRRPAADSLPGHSGQGNLYRIRSGTVLP